MNTDITELNNTLNITNFLNETVYRTLKKEFPTTHHNLDISITDTAYEGVSLLNIMVTKSKYKNHPDQIKSEYFFNLRIPVRINEQRDTNIGINPGVDRMEISKLTYTPKNGTVTATAPLNIDKRRNPDGMYTYEDIAQTIVEIITAIRHRAV